VSQRQNALSTRRNSPSVTSVSGSVTIRRTGRTTALIRPNTSPAPSTQHGQHASRLDPGNDVHREQDGERVDYDAQQETHAPSLRRPGTLGKRTPCRPATEPDGSWTLIPERDRPESAVVIIIRLALAWAHPYRIDPGADLRDGLADPDAADSSPHPTPARRPDRRAPQSHPPVRRARPRRPGPSHTEPACLVSIARDPHPARRPRDAVIAGRGHIKAFPETGTPFDNG